MIYKRYTEVNLASACLRHEVLISKSQTLQPSRAAGPSPTPLFPSASSQNSKLLTRPARLASPAFRALHVSRDTLHAYSPLLHNSRIPSETVIFLVTKRLCKRDHLIVGIDIMAFLLPFMFEHEG
jgi:hypothetical protein